MTQERRAGLLGDVERVMSSTGTRSGAASVSRALQLLVTRPGALAVVLYRLSHALWVRHLHFLAEIVWRISFSLTGADIHPACQIAGGLRLPHSSGIVVGRDVVIDRNVTLMQGVTLGGSGRQFFDENFVDGHPRIGDHTWVMSHASVLGPITVGRRCMIGAGSVVTRDLPDGTVHSGGRELADLRKRVETLERKVAETESATPSRN
ncbi:MAG: hypothetical protein M3290_04990 [Actinomycetota bacterium]|nr:hypothetical protein [Actinomycetota bacterium]